VSINLDRGFTVITGPNGSGKSNILDSLKFALGELSPRELRGGSLSDLVHKSTGENARTAYVAVQFDNTDRKIPVDSDLVTVSREFSRGGEGIYRLNGRRLSRKQVQDILSSGDIEVTGFNLIAQHSITRLAEISTEERRRILEDLIGLGVFETKKIEAKVQLQEADLNLKVAASKVEDVRTRIEQLERERNDLLRYRMLEKEISNEQGKILSSRIKLLESQKLSIVKSLDETQQSLNELVKERETLVEERHDLQDERRQFEEKTVTQGNQQLFDIERSIAEANNRLAQSKAEANAAQNILSTRTKQRASFAKESEEMENTIKQMTSEKHSLTQKQAGLAERVQESRTRADKLSQNLSQNRESLSMDSKKQDELSQQIQALEKALSTEIVSTRSSLTKLDLTAGHLQTLETRQQEFSQLAEELKNRVRDMEKLEKEEEKRLESIQEKTKQYSDLKDQRRKEIEEALDVAKRARVTVTEFNTQRSIADTIRAEEKALQKIEEMADEGAIKGLLGRLQDLIKFDDEYSKAVEAASAGWMHALVVKDLGVAIRCVESLKRTKLGRAKIIPLEDLELPSDPIIPEKSSGLIGAVSDVIKTDKTLLPAVKFVFGDTMLATNQRTAFLTAARGQRCVVTSGDLYEPGGGLESGYYRAPFDASSLVPRSAALEGLEQTVKSLESIVQRQRSDLDRLEAELDTLREDRVATGKTREALTRDVQLAQQSLERTRTGLQKTKRLAETFRKSIEREKAVLDEIAQKQSEIKRQLSNLETERTKLRIGQRRTQLTQIERDRDEAANQADQLLRQELEINSKLASYESNLETLKPGLDQLRIQMRSFESEIHRAETQSQESANKMKQVQEEIKGLNEKKSGLVDSLGTVSDERRKYEARFADIEKQLNQLIRKMDPINSQLSDFKTNLREKELQAELIMGQLRKVGFEKPLEVGMEEVQDAEKTRESLENEMKDIGAINQLADRQYEDVKDGYKQLSVRIGELEKEKLAILDFMNELDRRKLDTFMTAFAKVNQTFQQIFHDITIGGNGRMVLDNPDDPFTGGLDVLLQFPEKTELTIGSASGGEKSVSTVCYLLALQQIHPMPFYIMDEIDAHLDVLNTKRLATLLESRSSQSQFIVISLKDTTIAMAQKVYGVFIDKGGSQVISLPARSVNN
jgi:chromosome segregation protein